MPRCSLLLAAVLAAAGCAPPQPQGNGFGATLEPCRIQGASGLTSAPAECAYFRVPENPGEPDGTTIELFVARVPALNPRFPGTAFTILAGGPGQAATELYADFEQVFHPINRHHDILLVDQRGTGRSNALNCDYDDTEVLEFTPEYAAEAAIACLDGLEGDVRYYTTSVAIRDLDQVRAALGYEQLDLYGASYGTRVAQHYLKRYPGQVRSMIIDGVVPAQEVLGPDIAPDAQSALEDIFDRCKNNADCSEHFGGLPETFARLREVLRQQPVELAMPAPVSGELQTVRLDYTSFVGAVRLLSYAPTSASLLPLLLHEAGEGNWGPLAAQAQMTALALVDALSEGMHNAVMCTEDSPYFALTGEERTALRATYLGEVLVDGMAAVCAQWPAGVIDEGFHEPVTGDTPVLLLSGSADPVTPPENAEMVAAGLPNSLHIVAQGHGHGVLTLGCVPRLMAEFVDAAAIGELDPACVHRQVPAPFFTRFSGPQP